jgi:hypothetical protein
MSQFEQHQADALEAAMTEHERIMLDHLADALVKRRLTSAALFLLESLKPMGFVGSQMMVMMRPLIALAWSKMEITKRTLGSADVERTKRLGANKMGPPNGLGAAFEARADSATWDRVQNLLERRGAVELLLRRLEARA